MSEQRMDPGDSSLPSLVNSYLAVHPRTESIELGHLREWCEAAETIKNPDEQYHVAWMWFEQGFGVLESSTATTNDEDMAIQQEGMSCFAKAERTFQEIIDTPQASRMLKARATVAQACAVLHHYAALGESPNEKAMDSYMSQLEGILIKAVRPLLSPRFERTPQDLTFLHTVTSMLLINSNPRRSCLALPAPSRFSESAYPSDFAWNLVLWDYKDSRHRYRARVGSRQTAAYITISPEEYLSDTGYASRHGFGTLQAFADLPRPSAIRHVKQAQETMAALLNAEFERMLHGDHERPSNLLEWYATLSPEANPYLANSEYTNEVIARLESAYLGGELSPQRTSMLGWMLVERAAGKNERSEDLATADLETAAEIFNRISSSKWEKYADEPLTLLRYEALITREAILVQKAIINNDPNLRDQIISYRNSLANIANRIIMFYEPLYDQISHAQDEQTASQTLHTLLYTLTMAIAASDDDHGEFLAFPSSPRQQGHTEHDGWHITILRQDENGHFALQRHGRMRLVTEVAEPPEALLRKSNILVMSPADFGHKEGEPYTTLGEVISKVWDPESVSDDERASIRNLRLKLSQSTYYIGML